MKNSTRLLIILMACISQITSVFAQNNSADEALKEQVRKTLKENAQTLRFMENKGQIPLNDVLYYFEGATGSAFIDHNKIMFVANDLSNDRKSVNGMHSFALSFVGANPIANIELGESFVTNYNFFNGNGANSSSNVKAAKDLTIKNLYPGIDLRLYSSAEGTLEFDWIVNPGADYKSVRMKFDGQDNLNILSNGSLSVGLRFSDVKFNIPESYAVSSTGKSPVSIAFVKNNNVVSFNSTDNIDKTKALVIDPILSWGTYMDGDNSGFDEYLYAIQVDSTTGDVYCAGGTNRQIATNAAPYTATGYLNTVSGLSGGSGSSLPVVAVLYRINNSGNSLLNLTLFGPSSVSGTNRVTAYALSLSSNKVFIGGTTNLAIPMAGSSFDNTFTGSADGFVAVFSKDLGTLSYSTYLGGSGNDDRGVTSIRAIDDNTYVVGMTVAAALPTSSPNYISSGVVQTSFTGSTDFYIAKFSSLNTLTWGTYIGANGSAVFNDLEVLSNNTIAFCGYGTGTLTSSKVNSISTGSTNTDNEDGIIGMLNSTGTSFDFLDKIGGTGKNKDDRINDIEVVGDTLYWTGSGSSTFPVSGSGVYSSSFYGGTTDAIVGKCYKAGGTGGYKASFFGSTGTDLGNGIRIVTQNSCNGSSSSYILVFGTVGASGMPTVNLNSESFYNATYQGGYDIFFSAFNSNLNTLSYSSYIGGTGNDYLGNTGDPRGANHLWVDGATVYCGTTSHSTTFTPNFLVNGFDLTRSSVGNDAHIIFAVQFGTILESDYSDAPSSYGTPSHILNCSDLRIGTNIDAETSSVATDDANGDDNAGTDDEDAITNVPLLSTNATSYSVTVNNILNSTGSTANLYGWVDFNGNGSFESSELATSTVATGTTNGSVTLTWSGISVSGSHGSYYLRIRLTTNNLSDDANTTSVDERSTTQASDGEVEDYRVISMTCPTAQTEKNCQTQSAINTKFATWLATASAGGCSSGTFSNNSTTAPSITTGGTATITFTYTSSCGTQTCSSTFTVQAPVAASTSITNVLCYGNSTGAASISVTGGQSPYTYSWSNGATTQNISNLAAGTYTVTITDAYACTGTASATVTQPSATLSVSITSQTNVLCYGNSTGSVTVGAAGGTSAYQYKIGSGSYQSSGTFSSLAAGSYTITVLDANGCTTTQAVSITQPSATLSASITSQTNVLCYGNSTGSVTVAAAGGTSAYQYKIGSGSYQSSGTFSSLSAGSYTITVLDANGCTTTQAVSITQPSATLSASITSQTNVLCSGNSTGSVTIAAAGGTSAYQYKIGSGSYQSSGIFSSLAAGSYTVTAKDANNCTTTQAVTITQPTVLSASITSQTNVLCYGNSTGSVTVAAAGGTSAYQYKIGSGSYQASGTFSSLAAGSYTITVLDANGCTTTQAVSITQPSATLSASITSQTNVLCYGNSTGSVTVAAAGGTSVYQYKIGSGSYQSSGTFSSLAAGSYTITVLDANGCTTTQAVSITQPSATLSASITSQTNVLCYGNSTGSVTVGAAGGTSAYQYKIGSGSYQASGTFSSLAAGSYTITILDANGCSTTQAVTITQPSATLSASITSQTNILCYGNSTGSVTVAAAGGTSSYQYKIGSGTYQASGTFSSLTAGSYTVTVQDANGCTTTQAVSITQPSATLSASITSQTNVLCYGNSTGSVTVAAAGGTSAYQYKIGSGSYQSSGTFSSLVAGSYTITIKDANNCTTTVSVIITQPSAALSLSTSSQSNVLCYGNATGSLVVAGTGGTGIYTYKLGNGSYQASGTYSGLAAGTYSLTVKDANDCTASTTVIITQPSTVLSASITSQTNVLCYGNSTGSVTVAAAGGTSAYQYKIGSGSYQSSGTFSSFAAGSYTITFLDANGCTTTQAVSITQPSATLSASITSQTNVLCYGNSTGSVTVAAAGGTSAYQYKIGSGSYQSSGTFSSLAAGSYTITILDANGCTTTQAVSITQPSATLSASITSQTNVLCYGNSTGSVTVAAAGGTSSYQYKIGSGSYQASGTFSSLSAGSYTITVLDANGCSTTQAVTITQPSATLSASITAQTNILCYSNSTGSVTVAAAGGTSAYQYKIGSGSYQASGTFSSLTAGSYTVTVQDANGCSTTQAVTITQPSATLSASITAQTNILCYSNSTGSVTVAAAGGTSAYQYKIGSGSYQASGTFSSLTAGSYTVTVQDANGCTTTQAVSITQPSATLSASITSQTNVLCYGNSTGSVTVGAAGGTSAYQYKLDNGSYQSSGAFNNLATGSYTITLKDANNCTSTQAVTITQPVSSISASITSQTNVLCYGNASGSVTVLATGGTSAYQYKIGSGSYQSAGTFSSLAAGSYTITAIDANGCTTTQAITITQPSATLSASITSQTNVLCYGNTTGAVTVAAVGGTSAYQYKLDNGSYQSSGTFSSLAGGSYTVTVKDANNCTASQAVNISQPASVLGTSISSQTNVLCYGSSTGAVTVVASGATPSYQYKIGSGSYQASGTFSSLVAGSYVITAKDANNCTTTQAVTISQPSVALSVSVTDQTDVLCYGSSTGAVIVAGAGGTGIYVYKIGNGNYQPSGNFALLAAGTYTLTVEDANNCTATTSVTISQPSTALSAAITAQTNVLCYGNYSGSVTVAGAGGTTAYQYKLDNGNYQSSGTFSSLAAGSYTVTVKDANNCTVTTSVTISQPSAALGASISSQTNVLCNGNNTGSVTVVGANGIAPYQYKIGSGSYQVSGTFNSLVSGSYIVTIKDANNCTTTQSVTISQPVSALSVSCSNTSASSYGAGDASVSVSVNGGTSSYGYLWSNGSTSNSITGLSSGTYSVTVTDANGCTASCTTSLNNFPSAVWNNISATEDVTLNSTVAINDILSADGGNTFSNTCASCSTTTHGALTFNNDGTFTYVPSANFNGQDQFVYQLCDVNGDCDTAIAYLNVASVDDVPVAIWDATSTNEDTQLSGSVTSNDILSGDGGNVWSLVSNVAHGSLSFNSNGSYTYTPSANYNGNDQFVYQLCDVDGDCDSAIVYITVNSVNDLPYATWDAVSTSEDVSVSGTLSSNDILSGDGGNVWNLVSSAAHGSVIVTANGGYSYTPDANFNGTDNFVYQLCDLNGDCDSAIVYVTVSSVNDAPVAVWNSNSTNEDAPVSGSVGGNDIDVDNNINPNGFTLTSSPAHGSITFNADGTYTYTPSANYNGNDQFIYQVCDLGAPIYCDTAIVYLTINSVNDAPVAAWDNDGTNMNTVLNGSVDANDADVDGNLNSNSFTVISNVAHGTLNFNNDGSYTYTPTNNYYGNDQFVYQVCDLGSPSLCDTAIVYLTVYGVAVTPSVSISSSATTICAGTSVTFTATPTNGGTSPTYQWMKNGNNVGTNSATYTTTTLANGDVITVEMTSNAPIPVPPTVTSNAITMTVNPVASQPGAFTVSSSTIYWGQNPITYTVPNVAGVTYNWSYSGTGVTISGSGNAITLTPTQGSTSGILSVTATNGCGTSTARTMSVSVLPYITWQSNGNSNWNNGSNWDGGFSPYSTINVLIPSSALYQPLISANINLRSLTVQTGTSISIASGNKLSLIGDLINNGSICGGTLLLNGSVAQNISGNGTVCNFELDNSNGATITSGDTLKISQTYTPSNGVLNTNGGLELLSDENGTATVLEHQFSGTCTNYINGNVIVLKYIPGGRRAFRFLSHPFSTAIGLDQLTDDIDITGQGGSANGFTTTNTNNASAFWYNTLTGNGSAVNDSTGWIPFTNTNGLGANAWNPMQGVRMYIRGEKGQGLGCTPCVPNPVTIDMFGAINQCEVISTLETNANQGYNLVGNPYAANIDMSLTSRGANVGENFSVWDPHQGIYGAYVDQPFNHSYVLPAYSSFITTASANTSNTITFNEAAKVNTAPTGNLFKTTGSFGNNAVQLRILSNNDSISWDRMLLFFNTQAQAAYDKHDNKKMSNPSLDFYSVATDNSHLSIDQRPYVSNEIIPLGLRADSLTNYTIKVEDYDVPAGSQIYLHDNFLNTDQALSLGMKYNFTVTSNPMTQGSRFELRLGLINSINNVHNQPKVNITPNPATTEVTIWVSDAVKDGSDVEVRDVVGNTVFQTKLDKTNNDGKFNISVQDWTAGIYFLTIHSAENTITEKIMKQ